MASDYPFGIFILFWGPSWPPWSYGRWIYNYLYNQCLSPLSSNLDQGEV